MATVNTTQRDEKLEQLVELSSQLNGPVELEPFLQSVVEVACKLVNCQASSIFLYEEETELLKFVAAPHSHLERLRRIRVPLEGSVAGQAFTTGKPVIINDSFSDERVFREVDLELPFVTRSILAMPICYREDVIGVLEAVNKWEQAPYTDEDVVLLDKLASYAAMAIFNTALFEEAFQAQQDVLELEQKKSDFIAIASHELRTPLGLILGHATFLQETVQMREYVEQLNVIVRNAVRLKEIIEDLSNTDLARNGNGQLVRRQVQVERVIRDVCASFESNAEMKGIHLREELPKGSLVVEGDPEKIAIALSNLVKNALNFTDATGVVLVTAEKLPGYVKVSVMDTGIGIPAKDIPHVFDRFYQVEAHQTRRYSGMGLGLSVSKVMVELHGGQIWVESVEGQGSNFSFLLPVKANPSSLKKNIFPA